MIIDPTARAPGRAAAVTTPRRVAHCYCRCGLNRSRIAEIIVAADTLGYLLGERSISAFPSVANAMATNVGLCEATVRLGRHRAEGLTFTIG